MWEESGTVYRFKRILKEYVGKNVKVFLLSLTGQLNLRHKYIGLYSWSKNNFPTTQSFEVSIVFYKTGRFAHSTAVVCIFYSFVRFESGGQSVKIVIELGTSNNAVNTKDIVREAECRLVERCLFYF